MEDAEDIEMGQGDGDNFTTGITNVVVWFGMSFADKVPEQTTHALQSISVKVKLMILMRPTYLVLEI